ncbi:sodium:calcium antiporter [Cellulosilyticum ruminicola]|uniref:sodium:calcium antiporter n=1 Tax=Cellulosilyticum ruminicola TaxID=425254 RepID=UPI0006D092E9|nr:hypothetical protein [Cellulosilyticum ruminicola]
MIFLLYLVLAICVVFLSIKTANYVDLLDKKTNLSGAFIGGVMLAAVTSLPEFFTTISATSFLGNPDLALGNILGSNLFNNSILATLVLLFIKKFGESNISKSHLNVSFCTLGMYFIICINLLVNIDISLLTISILSIALAILYAIGVKAMANAPSEESDEEDDSPLTVKQIALRFVITSVLLIAASIGVTYVSDSIATIYNLGAGLVGAVLLGIATSLPEVTSCVALMKVGNFNIATGNIVGSTLFNFLILTFADLLYIKDTIYIFTDSNTKALLVFGFIAALLLTFMIFLKTRKKEKKFSNYIYTLPSVGILLCYFAFLLADKFM